MPVESRRSPGRAEADLAVDRSRANADAATWEQAPRHGPSNALERDRAPEPLFAPRPDQGRSSCQARAGARADGRARKDGERGDDHGRFRPPPPIWRWISSFRAGRGREVRRPIGEVALHRPGSRRGATMRRRSGSSNPMPMGISRRPTASLSTRRSNVIRVRLGNEARIKSEVAAWLRSHANAPASAPAASPLRRRPNAVDYVRVNPL